MLSRPAVRRTIGTLTLAPLAVGPLAVLAQATAPTPHHEDVWGTILKVWSAISVLVIAGLHLWVRSIVRDHTDAVKETALKALKEHDENPSAHANHKNPPKYAAEIAEVRMALARVEMQMAVILARIEAGQERNAEHWESLTDRLDHFASIETRVIAIESSCAIHQDRKGR